MYLTLDTPSVLVDLDIAEKNIRRFAQNTAAAGIKHRPHIKTHKSVYLAKKQKEAGAYAITCAKPMEAEIMADAGFDNILLAHILLGEAKLARYDRLDSRINMHTLVNSLAGAVALSDFASSRGKQYSVFIEVDGNKASRGGVKPYGPTLELAKELVKLPGIRISGLMHYCGEIYGVDGDKQAQDVTRTERDELLGTHKMLRDAGIAADILSAGSSFSSKHPQLLQGITEVRAGNYIFNDCAQLSVGMVGVEDCAMWILSTVVSKPDSRNVIIDAGSKTLTSDLCPHRKGYGYIIGHPDIEIWKQNEEHGYLRSQRDIPLEIGDRILIIPNHACTVANLANYMYGLRGDTVAEEIKVDARG